MIKKLSKILNSENGKLSALLQLIAFAFSRPGITIITGAIKKKLFKTSSHDYNKWIRKQHDLNKFSHNYKTIIKTLSVTPTISILFVIDKPDKKLITNVIRSIENQLYTSWELYLIFNSATVPNFTEFQSYTKIKLILSDKQGLAAALNDAIREAADEYCLFLAKDALLAPDSLFEFVKHLNEHPADDIIYGDEDSLDETGKYSDHFFKPSWSPDTLLSRNYIGNTFLVSKKLLNTINGLHENYSFACLYDLLLRATEHSVHIGHITKIISHSSNTVKIAGADNDVKVALESALLRRGTPATIEEIPGTGFRQINYEILQPEMVSIIIPTKDQAALLKIALSSIRSKTTYTNYEILVINNNSTTPEFFRLMDEYKSMMPGKFRVIDTPIPFNFSKLINTGVAGSKGKYILMLNNDIEAIDAGWLAQMVAYAQLRHTGAIGVKLLYPDNTIQHAGIVLGIHGHSGHVFVNQPATSAGYHNNLIAVTNYSALTAACLMCRKDVYLEAGGMNENLPVEFNDTDICLKFSQLGYYNVFLPAVTLIHHESATRGHPFSNLKSWRQHEHDLAIFKTKWQPYIDNDPFYNPNLSLKNTNFEIIGNN